MSIIGTNPQTEIPDFRLNQKAKQKWRLLKNVLFASFLFKNHETRVMHNIEDLVEEVRNSPTKTTNEKSRTLTSDAITDLRTSEMLFYYIRRSLQEDLMEINNLIENHPKKFARSNNDPDSFVNKANINGIRPIYEACKNGYTNTVQLLLDHGANPHLESLLSEKEKETPLEVSCRWSHLMVVNCLLNYPGFTNKNLKKATKKTKNKKIIEILKLKIDKNSKSL